jgi:hypothetical protein
LIHFPSRYKYQLILLFFYPATLKLGTTQHPLAHLIYKYMKKIEKKLNDGLKTGPAYLSKIIDPMKEKFNKYWSKMEDFAALNLVFDPHFKLELLEFTLMDELSPSEAVATLNQIKSTVVQCFNKLNSRQTQLDQNCQSGKPNNSLSTNQIALVVNEDQENLQFKKYLAGKKNNNGVGLLWDK